MRIAIQGVRTSCITDKSVPVRLVLEDYYSPSLGEWWVKIVEGGVTGYESCRVDWLLKEKPIDLLCGWCACAGTKMSWDTLEISTHEMAHVICALEREYIIRESRAV